MTGRARRRRNPAAGQPPAPPGQRSGDAIVAGGLRPADARKLRYERADYETP